jgi:hypothetical protein
MEPLPDELRAALKAAYPKLTDAIIDRTEALLSAQMLCNPETEQDEIARLDQECRALIRKEMPRYTEILQAASARMDEAPSPPRPKVRIALKKPHG